MAEDTIIIIGVVVGSVVALVLIGFLVNLVYEEFWKVYITPLWRDFVAFWNVEDEPPEGASISAEGDVVAAEAEGSKRKNPMLSASRKKNGLVTPKGVRV